ncbi:hypothetical protein ACF0H5_012164 [Mactra antiquata]
MSLGILTSKLQTIKSLKDSDYLQRLRNNDYVQRIQELAKNISISGEQDFSHVATRKSRAQLIRLSAAVCGIELCYAAETAFVSPILLKLGVPVAFMTLVWCVSPFLGFFLVPIMGSLSDRCPLKLGRRRPFIVLFAVGIIIGLVLVPNGESLGVLAGDSEPEYVRQNIEQFNGTVTEIRKINSTNSLVFYENGTSVILRSNFSPSWPSAVMKLPKRHVIGILLTVLGVAMLDFNCDACQSPCRTYLLDISVPEDHSRGLTSFTVMAGLGGSFGYLMGGIDWESTSFGTALGGHVRVVFTGVLFMFLVFVILTLTSFKEIPLNELGAPSEAMQKKSKTVKKAKYRKFVNESSDEESSHSDRNCVTENTVTYGTLDERKSVSSMNECEPARGKQNDDWVTDQSDRHSINKDSSSEKIDAKKRPILQKTLSEYQELSEEVTLKTYLRSIIKLPRSMLILCLTNLFCWMSLVCYSLYFTDFVGQSVYGGNPKAPPGSPEHALYDDGVRLGSFGMSLYSLSCALYSLMVEYLVERFFNEKSMKDVFHRLQMRTNDSW